MLKQMVRDWGRRLLIVLLFASAVLLLRQTGFYAGIQNRLERSRSIRTERTDAAASELPRSADFMMPLSLMVCGTEGGGRYGTAYSAVETAAVFRRFSVDLAEALGSAGAPAECAEDGFRACLSRSSVAMQFASPIRLDLLSGWLGVEMNSAAAEHSALLLCLSASESEALLCYRTEDGTCFACTTAVSAEGFRSRASEYAPNGAIYAWESEDLGQETYTLLLSGSPETAVLKSAVPMLREAETDEMLTAMGMNSFVTSSYSEADGTMVYVSDETTMRISPAGTLLYRRTGVTEGAESEQDVLAAVSCAWNAAEQCIGKRAGDGGLRFVGAEYDADQRSFTVLMDYFVDAVPVRLADGHAAELVVRNGKVIQARLQMRQFTRTSARTELLPCLQAAAIAARSQGQPELVYVDAGEATACMWVIKDG